MALKFKNFVLVIKPRVAITIILVVGAIFGVNVPLS